MTITSWEQKSKQDFLITMPDHTPSIIFTGQLTVDYFVRLDDLRAYLVEKNLHGSPFELFKHKKLNEMEAIYQALETAGLHDLGNKIFAGMPQANLQFTPQERQTLLACQPFMDAVLPDQELFDIIAERACEIGCDDRPHLSKGGKVELATFQQFDSLMKFFGSHIPVQIAPGGSPPNTVSAVKALMENAVQASMMTFSGDGPGSTMSLRSLFGAPPNADVNDYLSGDETPAIRVFPRGRNNRSDSKYYPQLSFVLVPRDGKRCALSYPGTPNLALPPDQIWGPLNHGTYDDLPLDQRILYHDEVEHLRQADAIAISASDAIKWGRRRWVPDAGEWTDINAEAVLGPAEFARNHGKPVFFFLPKYKNCGQENVRDLFQNVIRDYANVVLGNDEELMAVYGHNVDALKHDRDAFHLTYFEVEQQLQADLRQRAAQGAQPPLVAFITRGTIGSVLITPEKIIPMPPILTERSKVVNEIGAGDATAGGFIAGLLLPLDTDPIRNLIKSALLGAKMGSLVVQQDPARLEPGGALHQEAQQYRDRLAGLNARQLDEHLDDIRVEQDRFLDEQHLLPVIRETHARFINDRHATGTLSGPGNNGS